MYDELIKRLRNCAMEAAPCRACDLIEDGSCSDTLMKQAADAIEELSKSKWIPVTERLPEEAGYYITAFSKGEVGQNLYMIFADGSGKWYQNSEDTGEVTHWMPLPQPPKEEI